MPKLCPTCEQIKELTEFNKNKSRKDGYQRECRECCHNHHNKHYHTKKSPRLNENLKEGYKICSNCKQELLLSEFNKQKGGRFNKSGECKYCLKLRNKKWRENGGKQWELSWIKRKKQTDPIFRLKYCIRLRVNEILKKNNITKNHSGLKYLGCDIKTYKEHIEKQFTPEMNWDNHGIYWEIDHIKPLALIQNKEDCFKYFHYKNTQPLTISDNRKKGSSYNLF
jgi:hypothetical protein